MNLQVHPERMSQEDSHGFDLLISQSEILEESFQGHKEWLNLRMKVTLEAAKGLTYLHSEEAKIIYQDFKSSNILLAANYNAKLSQSRVKWVPSVVLLPSIWPLIHCPRKNEEQGEAILAKGYQQDKLCREFNGKTFEWMKVPLHQL
ncbi:hypothetical protein H5410_058134 [Solanum commersonii]|uniref:Protein kinase domain-containing protein n=1 Tax=Solanum commersonii TaxID=4109 RepID=A0A9J5WSN4_SOLCO|nr:hypothetical protein H5410_058134 [Solanum commersonii]